MKAQRSYIKLLLASAMALSASLVWGQDGLEGVLSRDSSGWLTRSWQLRQTIAAGDFDGDHKPDAAVLVDSGALSGEHNFRIELHFTNQSNGEIAFRSAEVAPWVAARDVNHDGYTDLVLEQPVTRKPLQVWLNDGRGGFHEGRVEDYAWGEAESLERLQPPREQPECPAYCLAQERSYEAAMAVARQLCAPASKTESDRSPENPIAASQPLTTHTSRAPPLSAN